jgi:hypothetical protein
MQHYHQSHDNSLFAFEATKGIHEADAIANKFFSQDNIEALQHGIRYGVYKKSGGKHVIDNQSEDELKIIMRGIYLDHTSSRIFEINDEIKRLNSNVLDYCIPRILQEIEMYMKYLHDSTNSLTYMSHAESTSVKGTKTMEMKPFF